MAKRTFTFGPSARQRAAGEAAPAIDREILRKTVDDGVRALENARIVPLARIHPDPDQPRRTFDQAALEELAASIRAEGILQPLWVQYRYAEDDYLIISGERRYRAAQMAGLTEAPVLIGNVGAATRFVHQLIENLQREDLNPVDRGLALDRLKGMLPGTWQDVAAMVGLTTRRVEQLRALPRLPELLREAVRGGTLSEDHARALARLPAAVQEAAAAAVVGQGLSTRKTHALVRLLRESGAADAAGVEAALARLDEEATAGGAHPDPVGQTPERLAPAVRRRPRSRAAVPVWEKALEFERVLERMPVLEYQEDRVLLTDILSRIAAKIAAIEALRDG